MNEDLIKYTLGDDTQDPIKMIEDLIDKAPFFTEDEPGLYHPSTSSVIKLRNNGMIDIFVGTNQGIRIDPNTKTLNMFTNNEKHHIGNMNVWANESVSFDVKKQMSITAAQLLLKAANIIITADNLNLDISRDKLSIGGKSMQEMDDNLNSSIDDTNRRFDNINEVLNQLTNAITVLTQRVANLEQKE